MPVDNCCVRRHHTEVLDMEGWAGISPQQPLDCIFPNSLPHWEKLFQLSQPMRTFRWGNGYTAGSCHRNLLMWIGMNESPETCRSPLLTLTIGFGPLKTKAGEEQG